MTKRTRLAILVLCIICFFTVAPYIVLYSLGYRVDFENLKITATGGIYVRTFPAAEEIIIDSKISKKPGIFNNAVFVQSLLPKEHTIAVKKEGYYDYYKTLEVEEKEVAKLENILLFKKNILFEVVADKTQSPFLPQDKFVIKNSNLYSVDEKSIPVIKGVASFAIQNNNILWLGTDGLLYQSDSTGKNPIKLTLIAIKIIKNGSYKITADGQSVFVNSNANLLILNRKTNSLDGFYNAAKDAKISPDGKNIVYFTDKEIYISAIPNLTDENTLLYESDDKISDCLWLNNDYIFIVSGDKVIISEIDYRGNINSITLSQTADKIFFSRTDSKLYVLTQDTLLVSEKLTP